MFRVYHDPNPGLGASGGQLFPCTLTPSETKLILGGESCVLDQLFLPVILSDS